MDTELLIRLCDAPGVSGREQNVRALAAEALRPLVDGLWVDKMGNLIGVKEGTGPKVMVSAHMDEIGFMVSHIDKAGFLRVVSLGGNRTTTLEGQRVIVHGKEKLPGLLFREGGWLRFRDLTGEERLPRIEEFYIDLGLEKEKADSLISIGDPVTMDRDTIEIGQAVCGKAMDDRAGLFVMIEALRRVRSSEVEICAVGSVQEEVGCRGAGVAAYGLMPDVAIAVDTYPAFGIPGVKRHEQTVLLGEGAAITIKDQGTIADQRLMRFLSQIALDEGIPHQTQASARGGSDAATMHLVQTGVPAVTVVVPTRYAHTAVELVHTDDLEACTNLVARFLERAHEVRFGQSEALHQDGAVNS